MLPCLRQVSLEVDVLQGGFQMLEGQSFDSAKLRDLTGRLRGAAKPLRKLERMLDALNERDKQWFYLPFLVLCVTTQIAWAIDRWRATHGEDLRGWLNAWADFEALSALGNYAFENCDHTFPEFSDDGPRFEAQNLGHPLIQLSFCAGNDICLNAGQRFYVVSGSNMSGKSTLLRAIGVNSILGFAGAPVRARSLRLSRFFVCASLSVVDSLLNCKSKFMAEMDRLRQMLDAAVAGPPVMFLIDEVLSGTNSRDRRIAAEAIVRTLVERGAIGALSTHDLALTEIAQMPELRGINVHVGSCDPHDPMKFDYRLKPGITKETNALAIARMAGVRV
jgi:DNA mismatch repair ATPase MutS